MNLQPVLKNLTNKTTSAGRTATNSIKSESTILKGHNNTVQSTSSKSTGKIRQLIAYIKSKLIKINKAEIKRISKLPAEQFLIEAQKLIARTKGYESEFTAPFVLQEFDNKKIAMIYNAATNTIYVNTANKLKPSAMLYAQMCHEYEHFHQNLQILRTAGLSEKAINNYSKIAAKDGIENFQAVYKNVKSQDLPALKEQLGQNYHYVESYVQAKEKGAEALRQWISQTTENDEAIIKQQWHQIRDNVIKKYGQIPENSKEAKKANEYYKGFMTEGSFTGIKKNSTINELEAYFCTILNFYNYLFKKIF